MIAWIPWILCHAALAWDERGPEGVPTGRTVAAADHFVAAEPTWDGVAVHTEPADLGAVAAATARVMRARRNDKPELVQPGLFAELGVSLDDVLDTLDLVARVASEDAGETEQRLRDPAWLMRTFEIHRWSADAEAAAARRIALDDGHIRLTKYLVYAIDGSPVRTERFGTALYADPGEVLRAKYTRPQVYGGVYDGDGEAAGAAEPLVWLTREGVNQALMQGTVEVRLPDGGRRLYNVHRNNGIAYDPAVKDGNRQERYWYFREVKGILGVEQIPLRPEAAVAGDVYNLGLGKLVALRTGTDELRLAVLADTGGAFQPNLFQLDWLAGTFPDHAAFAAHTRSLPTRVEAAVLVRRRSGE